MYNTSSRLNVNFSKVLEKLNNNYSYDAPFPFDCQTVHAPGIEAIPCNALGRSVGIPTLCVNRKVDETGHNFVKGQLLKFSYTQCCSTVFELLSVLSGRSFSVIYV